MTPNERARRAQTLITLADELDHYRQMLMDTRKEVHLMSGEARKMADRILAGDSASDSPMVTTCNTDPWCVVDVPC